MTETCLYPVFWRCGLKGLGGRYLGQLRGPREWLQLIQLQEVGHTFFDQGFILTFEHSFVNAHVPGGMEEPAACGNKHGCTETGLPANAHARESPPSPVSSAASILGTREAITCLQRQDFRSGCCPFSLHPAQHRLTRPPQPPASADPLCSQSALAQGSSALLVTPGQA